MSFPRSMASPAALSIKPKSLRKTLLIASLSFTPLLFCGPGAAAEVSTVKHYAIPSTSMEQALNQFGREAGILLSFDPALVNGLNSAGIQGEYSIQHGLDQILQNSGLQVHKNDDGSYSVVQSPVGSSVTLPTYNVQGRALSSTTEGSGSYTTGNMSSATGLGLSIRETPQSVTVMTRDRMDIQNLTSISQVMEQVVGIEANSTSALGNDGTSYRSRGFEVDNYLVDGVPRPSIIYGFSEETADMIAYDRVEVTRGSSGLMTGMGNPSASVNLIRKRATADTQMSVSAQTGAWDLYRVEADVSGSLVDSNAIRGRLAVAYQENDTFVDREHHDRKAAYGVVEADLTDRTLLSVGFEYQDFQNSGASRGGIPLFWADGSYSNLSRSTNSGTDWSEFNRESTNIFATLVQELGEKWQLTLNAEHKEGLYDESQGYLFARSLDENTGAGGTMYISRWAADLELDALSANLKGSFNWLGQEHELFLSAFHAEYNEEGNDTPGWWSGSAYAASVPNAFDFFETGSWPKPFLGATGSTYGKNIETTAFTAATRLNPTDNIHLLLGARVSDWQQNNWNRTAAGVKTTTEITDESGVVTPYAGIVGDITENVSAYASYTSIFEPQSNEDINGNVLDPLEGNSYETGLKGEFMDGKLNATLSVFRMKQENLAVSLGSGVLNPNGNQAYRAEPGATAKGFELEVGGEITPDWKVIGGFARAAIENSDGERINRYVPTNTFKLFSTYELNQVLPGLTIGGNLSWQDKAVSEDAGPNGEDFVQDDFFLLDLLASYRVNENLRLAVNLNNVFDKTYYSGMNSIGRYGAPRNVVASLKWDF